VHLSATALHYSISFLLILFVLFLQGCVREGYRPLPEGVMLFPAASPTVQADSIIATGFPLHYYGTITSSGSDSITRYGFCFSSSEKTPTVSDSIVATTTTPDEFPYAFTLTSSLMQPDTLYYARAFAENKQGIAYSETVISFVVPDNRTVPVVSTDTVENITSNSANVKAIITNDGGAPITAYGVCYSKTNATPDVTDEVIVSGNASEEIPLAYAEVLSALSNSTTYYVRAFTTNTIGTAYGNVKTFHTTTAPVVNPTVATDNVLNITTSTASAEGTFSSKGTGAVVRYGFAYSKTNTNPTINDAVVASGTSAPSVFPSAFSANLTGLTANTVYYIRAFATTTAGTSYGVSKNFKTNTAITTPPVVLTNNVASITTNAATVNGTLQSTGTSPVTKYGFCYSTTRTNPTVADQVITAGTTSPGSLPHAFSSQLTLLTPATTYYVRSFASSAAGTSYGASLSFATTSPPTAPPAVQTVNVSAISYFSASVLGNITAKGTSDITAYGVVFSTTNTNPTISDSKVVVSTVSPDRVPFGFTATLSSLSPNTTYYVRAYATSAVGTAYGVMKRLVTRAATPVVVTDQATFDVAMNTTTTRGTIQNAGASTVTRYGFCYSHINSNPTVADNASEFTTAIRSFPFSFSQSFLRLSPGTYYFRAYAQNSYGIAYGNVVTVTVFFLPGVSTDNAVTKNAEQGIETLSATITAAGSTPVLEYGFCYIRTALLSTSNFRVGDANIAVVQRSSPTPGTFPFPYAMDVTVSYNEDYSYRAYARTAHGYAYGTIKTFYINYKP
jgi:hypothetical protein